MIDIRGLIKANYQHLNKTRRKRVQVLRPVRPNYSNELWYKAQLLAIVRQLQKASEEILFPILKRTESQYGYTRDAAADDIAQGLEEMSLRFGNIEAHAKRLADLAAKHTAEKADEALISSVKKAVGIDIKPIMTSNTIAPELATATRANIALIKSIPEQYLDKVSNSVYNNVSKGARFETIVEDIQKIGGVTENRAKLIARDQTSKMNAAITQSRQTSIGISQYTWSTSGDERVRETHADNNGKVFSWNDPPSETGHPGEDINCRCVAIPFIDLDAEEAALGL